MNQESRKTGKSLRDSEITQQIIAAAIRVHRDLGPGFLESVYEEALAVEFALSGIQFVRQYTVRSSIGITRSASTVWTFLSRERSVSSRTFISRSDAAT